MTATLDRNDVDADPADIAASHRVTNGLTVIEAAPLRVRELLDDTPTGWTPFP